MKPAKVVEVPGLGNIEFPGEMDDAAIGVAIEQELAKQKPAQAAPQASFGQALSAQIKPVGQMLKNIPHSATQAGKEMFFASFPPAMAARGLTDAVANFTSLSKEKPTPRPPGEVLAEIVGGVKSHFGDRFGSVEKATKTLTEDPAGAVLDAATVAGGAQGLRRLAGAAAKPLRAGAARKAERMYQSALKPPKAILDKNPNVVATGLREEIPVGHGGLQKAQDRIDDLNNQIKSKLDAGAGEGKTVDPETVAKSANRSLHEFSQQTDPRDDLATIKGVRGRFLDDHSTKAPYTKVRPGVDDAAGSYVPVGEGMTPIPKPIPVKDAQALKQGEYRKIRKSYGELKGSEIETRKDLARGLKEQIAEQIPELSALNAREGDLIGLEQALERYAMRISNRDIVSLGTLVAGGIPAGGKTKLFLGLLKGAIDDPGVKSQIAIRLNRFSKAQPKPLSPLMAIPAATLNRASGR